MAKCTGCGYPNEYQESDYLCSQCKLMGSVFGATVKPKSIAEPVAVKKGNDADEEIPWTPLLIELFDTTHPKDNICQRCGDVSEDHHSRDNRCHQEVSSWQDCTFYNKVAAEFVKNQLRQ